MKKHRNDVFRLLQLLSADGELQLPESITADMRAFLDAVAVDETFEPSAFGLRMSREEGLARLSSAYRL